MSRAIRIILVSCVLLFILIWIAAWNRSDTPGAPYIIAMLVIAGFAISVYAIDWGEKESKKQLIRAKIAVLQQKKFALHSELIEDLSTKDFSSLRVYKIIVLLIVGAIGLIVVAVISFLEMESIVKLAAALVTIATLLAILLAINKKMDLMFENGKKIIVRGVVTKKNTDLDDQKDKAYQWIYIGDRRVKVEMTLYESYDIGDAVEFHLYERFGTVILHHEKLEGAGIVAE